MMVGVTCHVHDSILGEKKIMYQADNKGCHIIADNDLGQTGRAKLYEKCQVLSRQRAMVPLCGSVDDDQKEATINGAGKVNVDD